MIVTTYFKALADETRLRLINLLWRHELNVNEIVQAMGMGQSRISRHLKILTDSGLLKSRRDGLWIFYSARRDGDNSHDVSQLADFISRNPEMVEDYRKLKSRLEEGQRQKTRFFDSIASDWEEIRQSIFGDINIFDEIAARIQGCDIAADLGCGTGELLPHIKRKARKVIGVDKSSKMLEEAGRRLAGNGGRIELRIGEIEHLPMRDNEADAAVINMVLHHLHSPEEALREAGRVLKKKGLLVVVDLEKHQNEEMRSRYNHRWLGFTKKNIEAWLAAAELGLQEFTRYNARMGLKINLFAAVKR